MKRNTDTFSSLYYQVPRSKSKVKALLDGTRLPHDVVDLLGVSWTHFLRNDDETAAFYLIELSEAIARYLGDEEPSETKQ